MFHLTGQGAADGLLSAAIAGTVALAPAALQGAENPVTHPPLARW